MFIIIIIITTKYITLNIFDIHRNGIIILI